MDTSDFSLWGLFISAFISSTLLPGGSEVVLAMLDQQDRYSAWLLLSIATAGNTLGGLSTWLIGRLLALRYKPEDMLGTGHQRGIARVKHWGYPALLFSWLPVAGDPLCFAAGWLRMNLPLCGLLILVGKALRYAVVLELSRQL